MVAGGPIKFPARRFEPFLRTLAASGVTQLREGRKFNVDDYRAELAKAQSGMGLPAGFKLPF